MTASGTASFNLILDKMEEKLTSWRSKSLSPAGTAILVQSVSSSIPTHIVRCTMLLQFGP